MTRPISKLSPNSKPVVDRCVCDGSGFFRVNTPDEFHPWFGKVFRCICRQVEDVTQLQETLGTPTRTVMIKDLMDRKDGIVMKKNAVHFINELQTFFTVWGNNGTGKTTALMAITNELMAKGIACVYVTAVDLMAWIKEGIGDQDKSDAARAEQVAQLPVLCLDELTQVRWTEYVTEKLESILDWRYRFELRTAMAMDEDPETVLSPRFVSRMRSGAYIRITDSDLRPGLRENGRREAMERGVGE